ncbi:hypothetical protein F4678DRAFT_443076 [Xylaria arbuscula]|nr:hypothetical protein F4678DRAFT_443076 [Xylaria arbuscula]
MPELIHLHKVSHSYNSSHICVSIKLNYYHCVITNMSADNTVIALPPVERVSQTTFLAVTWTAVWISFSLLVFRIATRIKSLKALLIDDYLVIAAWLMLLVSSVLWQIKSYILYWMYDTQSGKVPPTVDYEIAYSGFLPLVVAWNTLFYSCLWAVKFSFLFFFRRLSTNVTVGHVWWWVVFIVTSVALVACIADIDYGCTVKNLEYITEKCVLVSRVQFDDRTFYANMAVDITTDLLIISIPFRVLWNVQIALKKKIFLLGVFSLTIIIIITSIIRVVLVKGVGGATRVSSIDWLYLWSNIEAGIAISVACLASFRQLFVFKQNQGKESRSSESSFRRLLKRYTLFHKTYASNTSQQNLTYRPESSSTGGSLHRIVPLLDIHIHRSVDITMDDATSEIQKKCTRRTEVITLDNVLVDYQRRSIWEF